MTNEYGVNVQLSYNRNAAYFLPKYREELEKMMKQKRKITTPIEIGIAESLCRIADSLEELIDMAKEQNSCDCCSKETDQDIEDYLDQLLSPSRKKTSHDEIFAVSIDPAKQPEKVPIGRFDEYETFTVDDEVIFEIPNTDMAVSCMFCWIQMMSFENSRKKTFRKFSDFWTVPKEQFSADQRKKTYIVSNKEVTDGLRRIFEQPEK